MSSPAGNDVDEDELTGTSFSDLIDVVQHRAPQTWGLVHRMAFSRTQEERNTHKDPEKLVLAVISILSYSCCHHLNRMQKLFAIYFKFRGLSAKGFDTLHALGLTMSNSWTGLAVGKMSQRAMETALDLMKKYPWLLSYDNATVSFRVFSQRLDNNGEFGNGTACTVYIKRSAIPLSPTANRDLQIKRAEGLKNPITLLEIWDLARAAAPSLAVHTNFHVLRVFWKHLTSISPYTKAEIVPFFLNRLGLGDSLLVAITLCCSICWVQLGHQKWTRQKCGTETLQAWVGDQLTVNRLRNIFQFRAEDENSFDRLDWILNPAGWLHIMMCFANSLHKQHLGTPKVEDSAQHSMFFSEKASALHHILEATGVEKLSDLRTKTPEELVTLSLKVRNEHGSTQAMNRINAFDSPSGRLDEVKYQSVMFTCDVLQYVALRARIKYGDIGVMEDMLPDLLFRFAGGKNSNYTGEVLEMLQGLNKEWPSEICDFIRNHCWVLNQTPKPDTFLPVDMAQEHNIKDIKAPMLTGSLKKLHPAIHIIKLVATYMESEFNTAIRGKKHKPPKREPDVQEMQKWQRDSKANKTVHWRKVGDKKDKVKNYIGNGQANLQLKNRMERWADNRRHPRATTENWAEYSEDSDSGDEAEEDE
ncbi:hypothetical protein C8J57DRAFT_1502482 [Mycena rebaudengoi]|nr:hypothetical protein C8J57DRAFT_1502482 [Mycena rebaudengoi]